MCSNALDEPHILYLHSSTLDGGLVCVRRRIILRAVRNTTANHVSYIYCRAAGFTLPGGFLGQLRPQYKLELLGSPTTPIFGKELSWALVCCCRAAGRNYYSSAVDSFMLILASAGIARKTRLQACTDYQFCAGPRSPAMVGETRRSAVRVFIRIAVRDRRVPIGSAPEFCPAAVTARQNCSSR